MRTALFLAVIATAACSKSDKSSQPAPSASSVAGSATTTAPAPTPTPTALAAAAPATLDPKDEVAVKTTTFMLNFAQAVVTAGDDCEKLATNLEALKDQAKAAHEGLEASKRKLSDIPPDPQFAKLMSSMKDPELLDKCEKKSPRAKKAIDETIGAVISPADDPELVKAFGEALGGAAAVH